MAINYSTYKDAGLTDASIDAFSDVDLTVQPEVLAIQLDAPAAGHGAAWLWTWLTSSLPYARTSITNAAQLSVPLYKQGTYQINNFANSLHSEMTQTHQFKLKWIEGAGDANLIENWVTYSTASHSHPSINGGSNLTVQRLAVNVPSVVTPPTLVAPSVSYAVATTIGAYVFSGTNMGNNVQLGPFYRGGTYTFNLIATGHPFYLTTNNGTGFVTETYVGEYTSGVTGSRTESGTMTFVVPQDAPDTLYYQCGVHGNMRGTIVIKDLAVETNENGNYIIYGQHSQEAHAQAMEIRPIPTLTSQMCIVYDAVSGKFVPQDLATYVENTPAFKNKIKEVAGTATLVAADGTSLVASVEVYEDASYLPAVGNVIGDLAYARDTGAIYIWETNQWTAAVSGAAASGVSTYANVAALPASATAGTLAYVTTTKALYVWDGSSWLNSNAQTTFYLIRAGTFTGPLTGTKTFSPNRTITLSTLTATVDTAVSGTLIFSVMKNGVELQQFSIASGQTTATSNVTTNSILATDTLTINIISGSATNLTVRIDYV